MFVQLDDVKKYFIGKALFDFSFYHNAINGTHIAAIMAENSKWRENDTRTFRCRHLSLSFSIHSVCHPFNCFQFLCMRSSVLFWQTMRRSFPTQQRAQQTDAVNLARKLRRINGNQVLLLPVCCVVTQFAEKNFELARIGRQLRIFRWPHAIPRNRNERTLSLQCTSGMLLVLTLSPGNNPAGSRVTGGAIVNIGGTSCTSCTITTTSCPAIFLVSCPGSAYASYTLKNILGSIFASAIFTQAFIRNGSDGATSAR